MEFDFLSPLDNEIVAFRNELSSQQLGSKIVLHTSQDFPEVTKVSIGIIGVLENRGNSFGNQDIDLTAVRHELYQLYPGNWDVSVADFGNIQAGNTIQDTYFALKKVAAQLIKNKVIPIVIGGGHNNAYPIIKTISEAANKAIDVINLDPHADCRALEGRHSGNSFSYAKENGYINHYSVLGLHKNYNSTFILDYLEYNNFYYTFFDDYILNPSQFDMDLTKTFLSISKERKFGIELDLDAIAFTPSSAFTPSGFNSLEARKYIKTLSKHSNCCYLHLPEAAPTNETEEKITGKLIAYLVADFIQENLTS